jgi:hypothetical protein
MSNTWIRNDLAVVVPAIQEPEFGAGRNRQDTPMQISQFLALGRGLIANVSVDLLTHAHARISLFF